MSTTFWGTMTVDGRPFVARACKAGYHEEFYGVELSDQEGRRMRVTFAENPERWFRYPHPGASRPAVASVKTRSEGWETLGPCGPLLIERGGRGAFDGETRLECRSERHAVVGRLRFSDCY
jgi:hypothetical protein